MINLFKDIFIALIGGLIGWGITKIENLLKEKYSTSLFFDFYEQKLVSTYNQPITIIKIIINKQEYPSAWFDLDYSGKYYENNLPAFAEVKPLQEINEDFIMIYTYNRIEKKVKFKKPQS